MSDISGVSDLTSTSNGEDSLAGIQEAVSNLNNDKAESSTVTAHTSATAAHGATGAVVGTTNTQTLTNKTLTTPNINQINATGTNQDISLVPTGMGGVKAEKLGLFSNRLEEYLTNALATVAVNFNGYNGGTTQFRDFVIYDGKNNVIGKFDGANKKLILGLAGTTTGQLDIAGSTSGTVTIKAANAAGTWTFTLPADDGTSGQVLTTDGNGVTSWSTIAGGEWALIGKAQLGSGSSTILSVSSISTNYDAFRVTVFLKRDGASNLYCGLRLNGDTGNNYYAENGIATSGGGYTSTTSGAVSAFRAKLNTLSSTEPNTYEFIISKPLDSVQCSIRGTGGAGTASGARLGIFGGGWNNISAKISQIDVLSFDTGDSLSNAGVGSYALIEGMIIT